MRSHHGYDSQQDRRRPGQGRGRAGALWSRARRRQGRCPGRSYADHRCGAVRAARRHRGGCRSGRRGGARGVSRVAERTGAGAGRAGQAVRGAARRAQGAPRRPGHRRGREDPLRGARRSAGDDRHLRLRGRSVPAALRPHDALRASRAPADGDLAPAGRGRRDLRVQLPGGRVGVERRGGPGLRRHRGLEALRAHPADRAGLCRPARPRHRRDGCPGPPQSGRARWGRYRRAARRFAAGAAGQRDRFDSDGACGGAPGGRPVRPQHPGTRREQRGRGDSLGGPRSHRERRRVRRRGHGGAAVHHAAAG